MCNCASVLLTVENTDSSSLLAPLKLRPYGAIQICLLRAVAYLLLLLLFWPKKI